MRKLIVNSSPHILHTDATHGIMLDVIIALVPVSVFGIALFGPYVAAVIAVCVIAAVLSEYLFCKIAKQPNTISNLSAVVTGLLLALNLPPTIPLWMAALGSAFGIIVVKQMFGGLGQNFANPAITARIMLTVSFPTAMTVWREPFAWLNKTADAVSTATPLAGGDFTPIGLILGQHGGCIGETCAIAIIIGGIYMLIRKVINPIIPFTYIATVGILAVVFGENPFFWIFTGGLLLGAFFMATDYVTSPTTRKGQFIFALGCGIITAIIRKFGSYPEGVSFSILLMNILVPHINNLTKNKPFGWEKAENGKKN